MLLLAATLAATLASAVVPPAYRPDQAPGTAAQVERGRQLYANCTGCHGASGDGLTGMAPRLNSATWLSIVSNDYIRDTLMGGRPGTTMIAWGKAMPASDLDALVAFIRSWQTLDGYALDEAPLRGDEALGRAVFQERCARCHGGGGEGYSAKGPGIGIGRQGFLAEATDGMIRALLTHGKSGTEMRAFVGAEADAPGVPLTPEQLDGVIRYLRANAK